MTAEPNLIEIRNELARRSLLRFTIETFENYQVNWHHRLVCEYLDAFANGEIRRLMIFMPPQTGKSELASRRLPCYMLGKNPDAKIAIVSYNTDKARAFNRECQRIIGSDRYKQIFPETRLNETRVVYSDRGNYLRNTIEFEIVGHEGKIKVAGIRGTLTGEKVDVLIADDLVKDQVEAKSPTIQLRNIEWWDSVAMTRLHNDSQILLLMTRWDNGDIPGRLLTRMRNGKCGKFEVIKLPSIKESNGTKGDKRKIGEALWPARHSEKNIREQEKANPGVFRALHQQDPSVPTEFKIFSDWQKIDEMPGHDKFYGLDFGFSNNPAAIVECQYHNEKAYVKELFYETGQTNQELAKILRALGVTYEEVICDGAEPKSIQELKDQGINATAGLHCANSVNTQILFLQGIEIYYVSTRGNLEFELDNYQWLPGPDGPINQELDRYNHLLKAVMYAIYKRCNQGKPGIRFLNV